MEPAEPVEPVAIGQTSSLSEWGCWPVGLAMAISGRGPGSDVRSGALIGLAAPIEPRRPRFIHGWRDFGSDRAAEGKHALHVPGHGHKAPLAADTVEAAHARLGLRVRLVAAGRMQRWSSSST